MIGAVVSHYKILEKLGGGGMGIVYKAEDTKLGRMVALKVLTPELTRDPDAKHRFIHEAKAASTLQHNNICTIHDIDETDDGQMFICMDFYDGETLKKKIEHGPLKIDQAIDFTMQIGQGLTAAHLAEEIHRDIKPANIMITGRGEVKIVDFGLARLAGQTRLTMEGKTLGTVAYMSPEQAQGKETDRRTDFWSLGVVLFEMITGQLPFKGEYENAILYSVINENPEPVTSLRSGVPLELERIITKCLEKDPSKRYQHADELVADLHRLQEAPESKSNISKKAQGTVPARKTIYHNFRLFAGILLAAIFAVAGYFIISRIYHPDPIEEEIKSIAVMPFDDMSPARDQEYFCIGMTEQITTNLSRLQNLRVRGRNSVMKFINTSKTIPEIARELKVTYLLEGSIRKVENRVRVTVQLIKADDDYHVWANDYDRELDDILDVQDDIAGAITGILVSRLSGDEDIKIRTERPANTEAYEYYMKGRYYHNYKFFNSGNIEDFNISEKMLLKGIELDSHFAPAYTELADLYNTCYFLIAKTGIEKEKYMKLQEQYLHIAIKLDSASADVYRVMGSISLAKGEEENGYQYTKKSLELDPNNSANNSQFGYFFSTKGLYDISIKYLLRAIETDPLLLNSYYLAANAYWNTGQLDQAEIYYQKALEIDPNDISTLYYYARVLFDLQKYDRFKAEKSKLEKIDSNPVHINYLKALQYILEGEKEKALQTYSRPDPTVTADFLIMRLYNHFGMYDEFIQYLYADYERMTKRDGTWYLWFKNAALFEKLRPYPRFQELLEKHKQMYEANLQKYKDIGA